MISNWSHVEEAAFLKIFFYFMVLALKSEEIHNTSTTLL